MKPPKVVRIQYKKILMEPPWKDKENRWHVAHRIEPLSTESVKFKHTNAEEDKGTVFIYSKAVDFITHRVYCIPLLKC